MAIADSDVRHAQARTYLHAPWHDDLEFGSYVRCKPPAGHDLLWDADCDQTAAGQTGLVIGRRTHYALMLYRVLFASAARQMSLMMKPEWLEPLADADVPNAHRATLKGADQLHGVMAYEIVSDAMRSHLGHRDFIPGTSVVHRGALGLVMFVPNESDGGAPLVQFVAPVMHLWRPPVAELRRATAAHWRQQDNGARQRLVMMYGHAKVLFMKSNAKANAGACVWPRFAIFPLTESDHAVNCTSPAQSGRKRVRNAQ